jgi:hypothetical protein
MKLKISEIKKSEINKLKLIVVKPIIIELAKEFVALKNRDMHPAGKFDKAKRFFLESKYSCCNVRTPSRAYPFTEMIHGRTLLHVVTSHKSNSDIDLVKKMAFLSQKYENLCTLDNCICAINSFEIAEARAKKLKKKSKSKCIKKNLVKISKTTK